MVKAASFRFSNKPPMKPYRETEIKLPVENPRSIQRKLASLGFKRTKPRQFERNLLYDYPGRRLLKSRCLLRLRFTNGDCLLTFKGAPRLSKWYKVRDENETAVESGEDLQAILEALGLKVFFRYEKYRTTYAPSRQSKFGASATVVFDETPIGNFLELEGPELWILTTARKLGFEPKEFITSSYASLHRQLSKMRGHPPGDMVFSKRKS
jgi:adenylate cyclase class 2